MRSCFAAAEKLPASTTRTYVAIFSKTSILEHSIRNLSAIVSYVRRRYRNRARRRILLPRDGNKILGRKGSMAKAFEGKVVLVTGANSGIGEAIAVAFQEAGATVVGMARRQEALEAARARHPNIRWLRADVADSKQVRAAVESAVREAGRLDVVVNNAGVFEFAPLEGSSEEMIRRQFEANVYGTTFVAQAALPALRASRGAIVNISSAAGHKTVPGGA